MQTDFLQPETLTAQPASELPGARAVRVQRMVRSPSISVFSCGGGTQSTAIAALIVQGKLPKPDFVVIADTGREMPTTWQYMDAVTRPALKAIGLEIHRVKSDEWARPIARGIWAGDTLRIPAFSNLNGSDAKLSAFCSSHWKQEAVDRWLSQIQGLTRSKYCKWIGFSMDETRRVLRIRSGDEAAAGLIRLPLVDDVPTKRHEAIKIVEAAGWPKPPRSRCWMCPNQTDYEWAEVKTEYPELWHEAVQLDESIRAKDAHAYLHSTIKPLRDANLTAPDDLFSGSCPSGECFL